MTTVGPYLRYGGPLVAACARAGAHYADLTGEAPFAAASIAAHDAAARRTGAKVVHHCGYDSVPHDLLAPRSRARAAAARAAARRA